MDLNIKDKVALVTGGAQGIGEAIVRAFAKEGCTVVIVDREEDLAKSLQKELKSAGHKAYISVGDLTEESTCENAITTAIEATGRLDFLVHNAGVNDGVDISQAPDRFMQSLQKNIFHVYALTHFAAPHLIKSQGAIINISSKVSMTGQGNTAGYAASKGAMNSLTREWALTFSRDNVRVNAIIPAEVQTPQYDSWLKKIDNPKEALEKIVSNIPLQRRLTTSQEIADMAVFLASPKSSHTTGQLVCVDGGYINLDRAAL